MKNKPKPNKSYIAMVKILSKYKRTENKGFKFTITDQAQLRLYIYEGSTGLQ